MTEDKIEDWFTHFRRHYAVTPDCDLQVFRRICNYAKAHIQVQSTKKAA